MLDAVELDLKSFERGAIVAGDSGRWRVADPASTPPGCQMPCGPVWVVRWVCYDSVGTARAAPPPRRGASPPARTSPPSRRFKPRARTMTSSTTCGTVPARVFLESDLATSRRFGDLILRSFVRGNTRRARARHASAPMQLAAQVADLHLNQPALSVAPGYVRLTDAVIGARAVVVAVGPGVVADLLPSLGRPETRSCTTWYHRPDQAPGTCPSVTRCSPWSPPPHRSDRWSTQPCSPTPRRPTPHRERRWCQARPRPARFRHRRRRAGPIGAPLRRRHLALGSDRPLRGGRRATGDASAAAAAPPDRPRRRLVRRRRPPRHRQHPGCAGERSSPRPPSPPTWTAVAPDVSFGSRVGWSAVRSRLSAGVAPRTG